MIKKVFFFCFIVTTLLLTSCYERIEGCLDPLSTNFAIIADDSCEECCVYPEFKFQVFHKIGEDVFTKDSVMINNFGQNVQIENSVIFLSDFVLHTSDGRRLEVQDVSKYEAANGDESTLKEDHIVIEESTRFVTLGSIREVGMIDSVSANAGINHDLISIETESALFNYDTLYTESYYDMVLYITTGILLDQDISIRIKTKSSFLRIGNSLEGVNKVERTEFGLKLEIDYEKLIKVIELEANVNDMIINEFELPSEIFKILE